ncbi:hypothetical protein CEUSTIGMA_g9071.t1 [Chlamydomonas eustigma]|uniref:Kinesin-like protein KIN-8B n=1 Tax=Chlamydomonas eustigma TaxID=1157962 RepID=A0A250XF14_9CHLO|nr:hypothetical protein CEUSTIGMA_g9071.t1 [Chlamydomonas eustigma]|eukprot:GAX81643.1 hypothetical protein CEUSTIGMA_g9071.t1 [Chlamydomonas eustigma]
MYNQKQLPVKLSSVVNASRYVPNTSQSSLIVAVRVRPLLKSENGKSGKRDIMRVMDGKVVLVLDPDESKDYLDQVQNRTKEKRYTFDVAFGPTATNLDVYNGTIRDLVVGVLCGINTTVFAYGATGSGKTYTMVGGPGDPGLMILSLERIFSERQRLFGDEDFEVQCSYLEVYNEVIYDLLVRSSGPLELREDPDQGVQVAGLKRISVKSADEILGLLEEGNRRRKTESTDANSQSSRSHAVLEINVRRTPRNHYRVQQLCAKLALVDLAGSERAADTNNVGQKLRDGANINRSLLALANCINALGKQGESPGKGAAYVPYRNSKLTRLLKDGLSGNSRTAMITTVSSSSDQYHHSIGTLKYADRAKEIKTHVVQNVGTVESHVADYQRIIDNLQVEVQDLKMQLSERPRSATALEASSTESDVLAFIDTLVQEMNDNIEERINLQKALFEIEDANIFSKYELKQLEEFLEAGQGNVKDIVEARDRRNDVLSAVTGNEKERDKFKAEIAENEAERRNIQARIDQLAQTNQNVAFLNLMSTFRLQAVRLQELKFQMAVRDQIIGEQREVIANLWRILDKSGIGRDRVLDIAKQEGIIMDGFLPFSEEERGQTPTEFAGPSSQLEAAFISGGNGNYLAAGKSHHGADALRINISKVGAGAGGMAGPNSNGHASAATPNASLVGNRAKMRYRFWAQYHGEEGDNDSVDNFLGGGSVGVNPKGVRVGKAAAGIGGSKSAAVRRKSRNDKISVMMGGGVSARGAAAEGGGGGGDLSADEYVGGGVAGHGGAAGVLGGVRLKNKGRAAAAAALGGGAPGSGVKVAVQRALAGVGNNVTAPAVRSGRRAGQPSPHGRSALEDVAEQNSELKKDFSFELPVNQYNGPGAPGYGARARAAEAWGDAASASSAAVRPPLPQPPALPAGLNERLAKLKLKLARKVEEVDYSSAVGGIAGGGGGVETGTHVSDSAGSNPVSARPSSEELHGAASRREQGDVLDRLISMPSTALPSETTAGVRLPRRVSGTGG